MRPGVHSTGNGIYDGWRKGVIAEGIQAQTTMKLDWIRGELHMGGRSNCARTIRLIRAVANQSKVECSNPENSKEC
jgi:hypothetical protein